MLPDSYEDCLTCHVEIEGAVISFEIGKHYNCRSSGLRLAVPCVVGTDVEHFVSLRCSLSPSPGSHLGMEIDPFVSGLVRVPSKL